MPGSSLLSTRSCDDFDDGIMRPVDHVLEAIYGPVGWLLVASLLPLVPNLAVDRLVPEILVGYDARLGDGAVATGGLVV